MNKNNNINIGDDPFKDLHLEEVYNITEQEYNKLTDREKVLVFCKLNGYQFIPPSPKRMISDEYYLGNDRFFGKDGSTVFPFWKDTAIPTIFGDSEFSSVITKTPFLVLSGAIGIGKSTLQRICLSITYARLLAMKNPSKTLGLSPKPLSAIIFHRQEETAKTEFKDWFNYELLHNSPFFRNTKNDNLKFKVLTSGPRGGGGLGSDLIFVGLGEINFWDNQEKAKEKLSTALIRFKSRFSIDAAQMAGFFIIDSSAKGNTDAAEWFKENTDPRYTFICKPAHYEVRTSMYEPSKGKTFSVFIGTSTKPAQILPMDFNPDKDMEFDKDKIIKVPIQLLGEYKANLIKSLQDLSGISTGSSDLFFPGGIEHLMNCSTILKNNGIPEVITIDFYNKQDRIMNILKPALQLIPFHTPLWVGLDLSAAKGGDYTGISICEFLGWKTVGEVKLPQVKCWCCVAIKNKNGQELSLFHIYQLLQDLNKVYFITVSADQAFSRQILQDCTRDGINNVGRISTDIVPCEPAIYLKNLINNELIQLPFNKRLQREASDLYYTSKGKIDHPAKATISKLFDNPDGKERGSKDVWDSLAQACYAMKLSLDEGNDQGWSGGVSKTIQSFSSQTSSALEETQKVFQGMLNNLF